MICADSIKTTITMRFSRCQRRHRCLGAFRRIEGPSCPVPAHFASRRRGRTALARRRATACPGSPATNSLVGRNSTVIPNNYLQLGREAKAFLHTRVCARRLLSGYTSARALPERGPRSSGPPAFRLQGGLPSLDTTRSRTDTYTRPSACNHPPRSPSFPRMTFRLSCCAGAELGARRTPPVAPDGPAEICPFRPLVSSTITSYGNRYL